jgi:hypothetical protein
MFEVTQLHQELKLASLDITPGAIACSGTTKCATASSWEISQHQNTSITWNRNMKQEWTNYRETKEETVHEIITPQ